MNVQMNTYKYLNLRRFHNTHRLFLRIKLLSITFFVQHYKFIIGAEMHSITNFNLVSLNLMICGCWLSSSYIMQYFILISYHTKFVFIFLVIGTTLPELIYPTESRASSTESLERNECSSVYRSRRKVGSTVRVTKLAYNRGSNL